jgi:hypothetical protein
LALIVAGVGLNQVDDSELVSGVSLHVAYLKVEPLSVGCGVVIVLEDQIVAVGLLEFDNTAQIATFEAGFKY